MRIGIVPELIPANGGEYQYALTLLEALATLRQEEQQDEFVLFLHPEYEPFLSKLSRVPWKKVPLPPPTFKKKTHDLLRKLVGEGRLRQDLQRLRRQLTPPVLYDPERIRWHPEFTLWFKRHRVDWILYTNPTQLSFETSLPYVMPVHDVIHRTHPDLPEISSPRNLAWREYQLRNGTRYATLIMADSEVGKEDIVEFYSPYGITPDRIKVLPFLPACYLAVDIPESECKRVRQTYNLPKRYLFYPAQFWPHKNHVGIVQALDLLKEHLRDEIQIVFSGSYKDDPGRTENFEALMELSQRLGVDHQIHYLGYTPDEDMSGLYAGAVGLIMPTFLGPTNIPILEAWAFGCPVVASDIRGVREQVQNAGLLVNPKSAEEIARAIYQLWTDEGLRKELTERGRRRLASYTSPKDFRGRVGEIIKEANERVRQGDYPIFETCKPRTANGKKKR